jgi:NAD+ synthase (glutamine-hydrolysing)
MGSERRRSSPAFRRRVRPSTTQPVETYLRLLRYVDRSHAPSDPVRLDERCQEVFLILATSLARRLASLPNDKRKLILGVSGGRDSTLAALVAAKSLDLLGQLRSDLVGVMLPGFGTTERTHAAARRLVHSLGASKREISIKEIASAVFAGIGHDIKLENLTFENVQAWARKMTLFALRLRKEASISAPGTCRDRWAGQRGGVTSH